MFELKIRKLADDSFHFTYYGNEPADELHVERGYVVRLMDESIDALMLLNQKMECREVGISKPLYRTEIFAKHEFE